MKGYDEKLLQVLKFLNGNWIVKDYQLAGMGWVAVINNSTVSFTLHSDRGGVDVYSGEFRADDLIVSTFSAKEIARSINEQQTN